MNKWLRVAALNEIPEGRGKKIYVENRTIALFKLKNRIYAYQNNCPHQGADLSDGFIRNETLHCLLHGWTFNITDGTYTFNPAMKLHSYSVKIIDNDVYIEWPETA